MEAATFRKLQAIPRRHPPGKPVLSRQWGSGQPTYDGCPTTPAMLVWVFAGIPSSPLAAGLKLHPVLHFESTLESSREAERAGAASPPSVMDEKTRAQSFMNLLKLSDSQAQIQASFHDSGQIQGQRDWGLSPATAAKTWSWK